MATTGMESVFYDCLVFIAAKSFSFLSLQIIVVIMCVFIIKTSMIYVLEYVAETHC